MGMLLVLFVVLLFAVVVALFLHAIRSNRSVTAHGWIVVVPLLIIGGWVIEEIIMR